MAVSIPSNLANLTLGLLNFTANCSNVALGFQVWENDFYLRTPDPGNLTTLVDGPGGDYPEFWDNGPSPQFIGFWRGTLGSMLPDTYQNLTDADIVAWTNHTEFYDFFWNDVATWPQPNQLDQLSNSLAAGGGCNSQNASSEQPEINYYSYFQMACMLDFCCAPDLSTGGERSNDPYPNFQNWSIQTACAFDTCAHANEGNPDLGGIGVIVAYFIEASLLFLSLIFFGIKSFVDRRYPEKESKSEKAKPRIIAQHDKAIIKAAGNFMDNAVYFSFAVNFASIIFNFRDQPLLYEDKLGQTSSLLAIDAPIAMIMLTYNKIGRRALRISMVSLAALMTFIIQFLFRKANSFDPGTSLCLAWDDYVQGLFHQRFEAKAVWAGFLALFVLWAFADSFVSQFYACTHRARGFKSSQRSVSGFRGWQSVQNSKVFGFIATIYQAVEWRPIIAYLLAAYGLFAIIIDIRFVLFLRHQAKDVAPDYNEDIWGYGQILAVFVWVPAIVEYIYSFGAQRYKWGVQEQSDKKSRGRREAYEMIEDTEYGVHKIKSSQAE